MSNKNLFKEAIADAKAVREAALANAKAALEEALTPKLQSMLAARLNEMEMEEEGYMGEEEEMEEGFTTSHGDDNDENLDFNLEEEEDFDLSEILAELDEEDSLNEAEGEEEETEETEESENVADMTIDDLKALIADIVTQEMGNEGGEEETEEEEVEMGGEEEESDEIDLEELLAELDAMGEGEDMEEESMYEAKKTKMKAKKAEEKNKMPIKEYMAGQEAVIEIGAWAMENFPTIAKALGSELYQIGGNVVGLATVGGAALTGALAAFVSKAKAYMNSKKTSAPMAGGEMNEAIRTINTLRNELNEVNLLNAKLLYVNKIFKAKNLSESQKLKVIASFDKATTAKEAKVVFESLNYTLTTATPKQAIKESLGFASRAAGVAPRKSIVESNDVITRMQKLANIIK
jgi:hypothetical protein